MEAFVDAWNLLLAHPFRWTYDGEGLHEKAVKRFAAMLRNSATQMELRILTKLLLLMRNLLNDNFLQVSEETWQQLFAALSTQSESIIGLINQEKGPLRKKKAQDAVAQLAVAPHRRSITIDGLAA